ncbi:MAG TPA: hypothetical protein ENN36_03990 [Candidatus Bathyarchaeota archaeon]|nr:hypothetical protein [Candidatus Bathyarchaeota archaeon]
MIKDVFWSILTILLFLFTFGALEFLYRKEELTQLLRANNFVKIVTDFTFIGLTSAFVVVMAIGILLWRSESCKETQPNEQNSNQPQQSSCKKLSPSILA